MFTLANPSVLAASGSTASAVVATAAVDTVLAGTDSFDGATPAALGTSATSIVAPASGAQSLVKSLLFFNTLGSAQTLKVYYPTTSNQIYQAIIPANGSVAWTPDNGWKIYDSTGLEQKLNLKSDEGAISGSSPGPYPLTFTPDGRLVNVTLDGVKQSKANYSTSSSGLTFSGLTMGNFLNWAIDYSY